MAKKKKKKKKTTTTTGAKRKTSAKATEEIFKALGATQPFLGNARAVVIACTCANTAPGNLGRTLQDLGVHGGPFQLCVFNGVNTAGYSVGMDTIPNATDSRLIDVVNVIQHAPKRTT